MLVRVHLLSHPRAASDEIGNEEGEGREERKRKRKEGKVEFLSKHFEHAHGMLVTAAFLEGHLHTYQQCYVTCTTLSLSELTQGIPSLLDNHEPSRSDPEY